MSHLTASPFHKPSPFEFPHRSNSGDTLSAAAAQLPTPASIAGPDLHPSEYFETPAASDHGHLGHTLASGPRHRLSQGLLMPLFPTMYGQLTAIAREYNFPSITGLCLYLHFTEHGITATPRISDDSWQMIWSHAFDPAASTSAHTSLPISGTIEFDIDMRLARWYGAWMASSHREHVDVPMSVTPSAAPSIIHHREESRTTFADGDDQDNQSVARPPPRHIPRKLSLIDRFDAMSARSVPRSVVARPSPPEPHHGSQILPPIFQEDEPKTAKYDLEHRVNSWRASASVVPGAMAIAETGHILLSGANLPNSPPLEESAMASNEDERPDDEYRIEDYSFSISSAGPGDYDPYSPLTWYYDPSIDLAHRAQGSVCMSPSVCTSFGPSDYTLPPYVPDLDLCAVRTPDIAHRMFEDVPPSPSVATSWGAPLSYPPSPTSEYHTRSVHLGDRQDFSRPVTPMTATSWGAPESYPPSPTTPFYVRTPDAGQRAFDLPASGGHDTPWAMVWPFHDTARPWAQVWPYHSDQGPAAQAEEEPSFAGSWNMVWPHQLGQVVGPWTMVWPYHASPSGSSSGQISVAHPSTYPCLNIYPAVYPHFDLYPAASGAFTETALTATSVVYPHFDLYPAVGRAARPVARSGRGSVTIRLAPAYPGFDLYPATYPENLDEIYPSTTTDTPLVLSTRLSPRYPSFDLYPAVYPHIVPYPPSRYEMETLSTEGSSSSHYPNFNLYPAVAPSARKQTPQVLPIPSRGPVSVVLPTAYPVFNLCELLSFLLCVTAEPSLQTLRFTPFLTSTRGWRDDASERNSVSIRLIPAYPVLDLYAAVYPAFDLYPALPEDCWEPKSVSSSGYPDFNIYPPVFPSRAAPKLKSSASIETIAPISVRLPASYPVLDLYPPVYPIFEIYPEIPGGLAPTALGSSGPRSVVCYPMFDLYPAEYPEIYPARAAGSRRSSEISVRLVAAYPTFDLYPALYPFLEIYPSRPEDCALGSVSNSGLAAALAVYPIFNLYAPASGLEIYPLLPDDCAVSQKYASYGYPYFNLYPPAGPAVEMVSHPVKYPNFDLYPAVYPYFDLYPAVWRRLANVDGVDVGAVARYPVFDLYPAVYPYFDLYPGAWSGPEERAVDIQVKARYPYMDLYPAVYPHFDLWPTLSSMEAPRLPTQSRFTRSDLHALVNKSTLSSQFTAQLPSKTHEALHMAVFPRGAEVLTPSGTLQRIIRTPSKTHFDLHLAVFPSGVDSSSGSGFTSRKVDAFEIGVCPADELTTFSAARRWAIPDSANLANDPNPTNPD
ncbi:hypothetical protein B0H11DRAFT_2218656 [Mycena galericulata]|nr:hypothetical protein B0H11DRAFT_2218656 [Mycena galericulata]